MINIWEISALSLVLLAFKLIYRTKILEKHVYDSCLR